MPHTYTRTELQRAFEVLPYKLFGITLDTALADPLHRPVIHAKAAAQRQMHRDLARQAERRRAGRWLERSAGDSLATCDAYDYTDRTAHLGEVAA